MLLLIELSNTLQQMTECTSETWRCMKYITGETNREPQAENKKAGYYLQAAIVSGKPYAVQNLLKEGHNANTIYNGMTPLNLCICMYKLPDSLEIVKALIKYGANVNLHTPLHAACRKGLLDVIGQYFVVYFIFCFY